MGHKIDFTIQHFYILWKKTFGVSCCSRWNKEHKNQIKSEKIGFKRERVMRYPRQKLMQKQTSTQEKLLGGRSLHVLLKQPLVVPTIWPQLWLWMAGKFKLTSTYSSTQTAEPSLWTFGQPIGRRPKKPGWRRRTLWDQMRSRNKEVKGFSMIRHSSVRLFPACLDLTTWQCGWQVNKLKFSKI